jgi:hypothetical protein
MELITVSLDSIQPNPWNPNRMPEIKYKALKKSLQEFPEVMEGSRIIVREIGNKSYEIINGEHRFKVLKELKEEKALVQNLGHVNDAKAKLMTLALANVGREDYDKKIEIINDIQNAFDLKNIAEIIGIEFSEISKVIDELNEDMDDTESILDSFAQYSTEYAIEEEDMIFNDLGMADLTNDLTGAVLSTDKSKMIIPSVLSVMVFNHNPIRKALKLGIELGHSSFDFTITEACKCFIKEEKERLRILEEKKKKKAKK